MLSLGIMHSLLVLFFELLHRFKHGLLRLSSLIHGLKNLFVMLQLLHGVRVWVCNVCFTQQFDIFHLVSNL